MMAQIVRIRDIFHNKSIHPLQNYLLQEAQMVLVPK